MARKGLVESNERKKRLSERLSSRRNQLKQVIGNLSIPLEQRFEAVLRLAKMPRNSSPVRIRARCVETGRSRGVYRFCGLSRVVLRERAVRGQLPGVKRSSW